jgi:hypothetical protein
MDQCKSTLSAPRKKLLQTMQHLHFGTIEGLVVKGGEPCFTPAPKITQEIKLGTEIPQRPTMTDDNFALKRCVTDLFEQLGRLPDDSAVTIDVRHGLPARLIVARSI